MLSVIIPNLHSPVIGAVLNVLRHQSVPPTEIVVVGQDRYGQIGCDELVRFVETPQPISAAAARNLGAARACGELLLFIDADCVAAPNLVAEHLAQHARGHQAVGGAYAPATPGFWALCDHLTSYTPFVPEALPGPRPYLLSGNLSISARLFAQVGGFDERFGGAAGEDLEFGLRLVRAGVTPFFHPGAIVEHHSPRQTLRGAMGHLEQYGAITARICRQHHATLPRSAGYELAARMPWLLLLLAPALGLLKALPLLWAAPFLRRYWYVLPGMAAQHGAWCWGFGVVLCREQAARAGADGRGARGV